MGFYGKVNNKNATQFAIDKIYSNRAQMEKALAEGDGVFIGRYVLVDYGKESLPRLYKIIENGVEKFYFSRNLDDRAKFLTEEDYNNKYNNNSYLIENYLREGDVIFILDEELNQEYYICIGGDEEGFAEFASYDIAPQSESYFANYREDVEEYGDSRGFDSTVWQKIYVDEAEKYVMIAELNSVVPTFDLTIDAPTEEPATPHFDADSTNVYYKLHVQPNWGFRIKPSNDGDVSGKNIFYNKAGFNKYRHSWSGKADIIEMTKAKSGKAYNTHNPANPHETKPAEDIQELSIILPSIGNAISDVWDIMFDTQRNTDISWDSTKGLRLVHEEDGAGFSYSKSELDTVAASINSIHDLMGMIIVDNVNDIDVADTDKIYYGDLKGVGEKGYYIKEKAYEYTPITDEEELAKYIAKIEPVKLTQFEANKYYNKTNTGFALVTTTQYKEGTNYYILEAEDLVLDGTYEADKYFYLNEPTLNYIKDLNELPDENFQYYDIEFIPLTNLFYHPEPHIENEDGTFTGLFYDDKENKKVIKIDGNEDDPEFNPNGSYFIGKNYTTEEAIDENLNYITIYEFGEKEYLTLIEFKYDENNKSGNYYSIDENGNYICLTNIDDINDAVEYGRIVLTAKNRFYEPNLYYSRSNNDFIFSEGKFDENANYVILTGMEKPVENKFYEPNKYYYKDNFAIDRLDTNENMTPNREYFLKYFAYIYEDTRGILDKGAEWNGNVKVIPEEITLAERKIVYEWKRLEGFARTLNTIHGLIIRINNLIKFDDYLTRDNRTVQGCINLLNDIINTFATLMPGEIAIVDEYGRLASAPFETDEWINLEVNDDSVDHKITITHEFNKVDDSISSSDMNNGGDTINLYTPHVDEMGHVVGKNIETVTLPFGYKTFQDANSPIGETVAASTKDKIVLSGDDWIKPTVSQGKFEYSHIGPVEKPVRNETDKTPLFGETFEIEDWVFDDKGHKTNLTTHTVQIPKGSLSDENHNNADVITQLAFESSTGKLETTRKNVGNLLLTDYVIGENNADVLATDTVNQAFGKLQVQIIDEEKARIEAINKEIADREKAVSDEAKARAEAVEAEIKARIEAIQALDVAEITTDTFEVFGAISETDGKISATKKKAGDLTLNGWTLGDGTDTNSVNDTDTINGAFGKVQRQLNSHKSALDALNGGSTTPGSVAYQIAQIVNENNNGSVDTLNEIAAWIVSDTTGAAKMQSDILTNHTDIEKLNNLVGTETVQTQINNSLIIDGVEKYALATDFTGLTGIVNTTTEKVEALEAAVPAEKIAKWDAAVSKEEYEEKIAELEQENYTLNSRCNVLDKEVKNLINKLASLEERLTQLENK